MVIAWLISGSLSGNTTSITTPWISSMRPRLRAGASPLPECWLELVGSVVVASICVDSPLYLSLLKSCDVRA